MTGQSTCCGIKMGGLHKVWTFVAHNMIMRKRALKQSRFFVDQQLGDPQITVGYLQERLARGDTSFTNKLLYCGANLRGTAQYWLVNMVVMMRSMQLD